MYSCESWLNPAVKALNRCWLFIADPTQQPLVSQCYSYSRVRRLSEDAELATRHMHMRRRCGDNELLHDKVACVGDVVTMYSGRMP